MKRLLAAPPFRNLGDRDRELRERQREKTHDHLLRRPLSILAISSHPSYSACS
jgi:hypothetical protein